MRPYLLFYQSLLIHVEASKRTEWHCARRTLIGGYFTNPFLFLNLRTDILICDDAVLDRFYIRKKIRMLLQLTTGLCLLVGDVLTMNVTQAGSSYQELF
jgi:hypothetical protein